MIVSCIFASIEKICGDDVEADDALQYEVDMIDFELPKVRFNFDVSPPPPPPIQLAAYEALVEEDPDGFQLVRARLEEIFPRLSDVATSSMGATVGSYIADFTVCSCTLSQPLLLRSTLTFHLCPQVSSHQLTKAYLVRRNSNPS